MMMTKLCQVREEHPQLGGEIRYLVCVDDHEVIVERQSATRMTAMIRGLDPAEPEASEIRHLACQAVRGLRTVAQIGQDAAAIDG